VIYIDAVRGLGVLGRRPRVSLKIVSLLTLQSAYTVFPCLIKSNSPCCYKKQDLVRGPCKEGDAFSKKTGKFLNSASYVCFFRERRPKAA
jgi:hypothetical protein